MRWFLLIGCLVALGGWVEGAEPATFVPTPWVDTRGVRHEASAAPSVATVYIFLGIECPVSNGYAPSYQRLAESLAPRGVAFIGVYSDPDVTTELANRHAADYRLLFPLRLDPEYEWAMACGVARVPTAVVVDGAGKLRYRGRIDDRYTLTGVRRPAATTFDLHDTLNALLVGIAPEWHETPVFGCPLPRRAAASE